jgi:hypothetical protein
MQIASLPDDEVLALCDLQMTLEQHEEIRDLLADQRESIIDQAGRARLSALLELYDRYLLRKSEALKISVQRGLRPHIDIQIAKHPERYAKDYPQGDCLKLYSSITLAVRANWVDAGWHPPSE